MGEAPRSVIAHYWHTLPGPQWFSAAGIYADQVRRARDGAVFVEVGSWKGRSTSFMAVEIANSGKLIDFRAVDHWRGSLEEKPHEEDEDVRLNRLYEVFLANIEPVKAYVQPIRSDSVEAAAQFEDQSVDFLYVDAGHTSDAVARDLAAWWSKLKSGGTMAGDDWLYFDQPRSEFSVRQAVIEFFLPLKIPIHVQAGDPATEWEQWLVVKP